MRIPSWARACAPARTCQFAGPGKMVRVPKQRPESAEEDLVRLYLGDIGRHALLTKDDEARLAMAIEEGNTARTELQRAEDAGERLTPARKRELRAKIRSGEDATQTFIQANL